MMRSLFLLGLFLAFSCGTRGALYTAPIQPLGLVATSSALVLVVPENRRAVIIHPDEPAPRTASLSEGARIAVSVPGSELVAVLAGSSKSPVVDLVDASSGSVITLPSPGAFDTIHFSPNGRIGVLTYLAGKTKPELAARNLNEVGVLDAETFALTRLQLDTESLSPRAVVFGPSEDSRQLIAVTFERGVAIFDAFRPGLPARRVPIRAPGGAEDSSVLEALFSENGRWLFIRASRLDEVIAVELTSVEGAIPAASVNFIGSGRGLTDIELPPPGSPEGIIAVYTGSQEAVFLDATGIAENLAQVSLPPKVSSARPFSGSQLLLFAPGAPEVVAWNVADGRTGSAKLEGALSQPALFSGMGRALFSHSTTTPSAGGGPALSVFSVDDSAPNRLRAYVQSIQLRAPAAAQASDEASGTLFFAGRDEQTVVTLKVRSLELSEATLDADVAELFFLPARGILAAVHSTSAFGDLTLIDPDRFDRAEAKRLRDFGLSGELDRPNPELVP